MNLEAVRFDLPAFVRKGYKGLSKRGTQLHDGERLVAEQDVVVRGHHVMSVRISEHPAEGFWRLDVSNPAAHRATMTTTVSEADSFLMHLINDAVGGQPSAWKGLAEWGQDHLSRPVPGFRLAPAG